MKLYYLNDLLKAIGTAIATANRGLQQESVEQYKTFFSQSAEGTMQPKSVSLLLPKRHVPAGEPPEGASDVPESTLTHQHQIALDSLSIEFQCLIEGLEESKNGPSLVTLALGSQTERRSNAATLRIEYKCVDPPEGTARINDQLLKKF